VVHISKDIRYKWKPWYMSKGRIPTSKKLECKFFKLELMYKKDRMIAYLRYKRIDNKIRGDDIVSMSKVDVRPLFSKCGGVWPVIMV
jgi:hypothetical protein